MNGYSVTSFYRFVDCLRDLFLVELLAAGLKFLSKFLRDRFPDRPNLIRIVDNIGWLIFDKIFRMCVSLFLSIWIARYLGPELFGDLNYALAMTAMFAVLAGFGIESLLVRELVNSPDQESEVLGTAAVLWIVGGALAVLCCIATQFVLPAQDSMHFYLICISIFPSLFYAFNIALFAFTAKLQMKYAILVQNSVFIVFSILKITLIMMSAPVHAFAWATSLEVIVSLILVYIIYQRRFSSLPRYRFSLMRAKDLIWNGFPLLLSGISISIYMRVDQVMIGQMLGSHDVGVYSAAIRVSELWYFIPNAIIVSLFPAILNAKNSSEEIYQSRLGNLFCLIFWLSVSVSIFTSLFSPYLVSILYGAEFQAASLVLTIHVWAGVLAFMGVVSNQWYLAENLQSISFYRVVAGVFINLGLNFILIPMYGPAGAAIATLIAQFIVVFIADFVSARTRPIFYLRLKALSPFFLVSMIVRNRHHLRAI